MYVLRLYTKSFDDIDTLYGRMCRDLSMIKRLICIRIQLRPTVTFTPSEVAHKAHKTGLSAVALTDHDTIKRTCRSSNVLAVNTELRVYLALK